MNVGPWLSVKEAAYLMGYSAGYFRRTFCKPDHPLVTIRLQRGRILVLQIEVEALVEAEVRRSANYIVEAEIRKPIAHTHGVQL